MSFDENLGANRIDQSHLAPAVEVTPAENVHSVSDKTVAPKGGVKAKQPPDSSKRGKKGKYQGQTGPRSKRGKERSRQNCVMTHGLRAKKLLMPFEDPKEYEKHLQGIINTLKPQDAVEDEIIDAYAYAIWSSPRSESYQQSQAQKQYRELTPAMVAKSMGLSARYQDSAPQYLLDIDYEVPEGRIVKANYLIDCFSRVRDSMDDGDPNTLDWPTALVHYRSLFVALHDWLMARGDEIGVFADDGKTMHPELIESAASLWSDALDFYCFLYFEANFMTSKPKIALCLERTYWDNAFHPRLGFTEHFQKTQNFAFTQLERLARYRKMKEKFGDVQQDDEGD